MSSQLNILDHAVMGVFLKHEALTIRAVARLSESQNHKVSKSVEKLMGLGFVRRVEYATYPSFALVVDCPYFPPVAVVTERVFSFENPELKTLVAQCDEQLLTNK
jgi:hypothetical protein